MQAILCLTYSISPHLVYTDVSVSMLGVGVGRPDPMSLVLGLRGLYLMLPKRRASTLPFLTLVEAFLGTKELRTRLNR